MKNKAIKIIIILLLVCFTLTAGYVVLEGKGQLGVPRNLRNLPEETEVIHALVCGVDYSEELTDVIMYVRYDPKAGKVGVLSIPRDTFLGDEFPTGKINAVYRSKGSFQGLADEVEERMGLPVDFYAAVTLDALGEIVEEIGGVNITLEEPLYEGGQLLFEAGPQNLNGERAQLFVRLRHAYADADLGRINAQHQFLVALMYRLQSMGKIKMLELMMAQFDQVSTNIDLGRALSIASTAFSLGEEDIEMFTVPGLGKMNGSYAVYEVDKEALAAILSAHFLPAPITAQQLDFPAVTYVAPPPPPEEEAPPGEEEGEGKPPGEGEVKPGQGEDEAGEEDAPQSRPKAKKVERSDEGEEGPASSRSYSDDW